MARIAAPTPWSAPAPALIPRDAIVAAAEAIVGRRLWCTIDVCVDVPAQQWEPRLILFLEDGERIADEVADWIVTTPALDVRLAACRRSDLRPEPAAPTQLCSLAGLAGINARSEGADHARA